MKLDELNIGDRVSVREWDGKIVVGAVTELENDIKNGYPGIGYELGDGEGYWCYMDQIRNIVSKKV